MLPVREEQKQLTRDRIVQAALEVFEEQGYRGATIAQISHRAGVGRATFYRHFADKSEVANDLALRLHPRMTAHFLRLADVTFSRASLREWILQLVAVSRSYGAVPAVVNEALGHNHELALTLVASMRGVADELQLILRDRGRWPAHLTPGALEAMLLATTMLVVIPFGPEPHADDDTHAANFAEVWLRLLVDAPSSIGRR